MDNDSIVTKFNITVNSISDHSLIGKYVIIKDQMKSHSTVSSLVRKVISDISGTVVTVALDEIRTNG